MKQPSTSQFHNAEIAVQERLGVADMVARYSEGFIRPAMPEQHRDFFTQLPMVVIGVPDKDGYPWAMPLHGKPGFIQSPDAKTLTIATTPALTNVLKLDFADNKKIGFLGIEPHTRRRNRMNGVLKSVKQDGFAISVEQSFGNCPQYIQKRHLNWVEGDHTHSELDFDALSLTKTLTAASIDLLNNADTFYIASRTKIFSTNERCGIDVSHRGGKPGFVKIEGNSLYFPDFSGNRFFNTLGNIHSDGRVGLFIPDYKSGSTLFIIGFARIIWDADSAAEFEGAERIVSVDIHQSLYVEHFLAMRGELEELSPSLLHTGTWPSQVQTTTKSSYQTVEIIEKVPESRDITSFYFKSVDGSETSTYLPGQFLPIKLPENSSGLPILRSYTLSQAPKKNSYRISVKREEKGLASRRLHDTMQIGDRLEIGKPAGQFTLQNNDHTVVMLSGGVGITPMIAMLEGLAQDIENGASPRKVWFVHGTQNSDTYAFSKQLNTLAKQHPWLRVYRVFSQPKPSDILSTDYDFSGRITIDLLKQILPFDHFDFYLCGSEPFMRSLYTDLTATGVMKTNIFYEFFGEGSIEENPSSPTPTAKQAEIVFTKSKITATWKPEDGTLLEFAEKQGLQPIYSCRTGNCGVCSCTKTTGAVTYDKPTSYTPDTGAVLICSAKPAVNTDTITLDL
ncbi:FAD-binding oxidoreductase [Agaribacter flavus]|uniref:Pyridoxamine 5'-phosphate oxidase family protein n=1 Tax=Agaribacter flavus TaxID=1902781 RepID=A0ABV7FI92_9ALTE